MSGLAELPADPRLYWYKRIRADMVDEEVRAAGIAGLRLACAELDMAVVPVLAWMRRCAPPTRRTVEHWWSGKELGGSCSGAREIRVNAALYPYRAVEAAAHEAHHAYMFQGGLEQRRHLDEALELAAEHFGVQVAARWSAGERGPAIVVPEWRPRP
jgi:hypothetical protein